MGTAIEFDLNTALQLWRERLGQSPQFKTENLNELESHVRDSVVQLQSKGLSSEESFLIATRRAGTPAQLEPEFAKVNRNPLNQILHGVILIFFALGCWFLWALLHFPQMMERASQGRPLPAFTRFIVDLCLDHSFIAVPPVLAAVYCAYIWIRKANQGCSWIGFFAVTMATLFLLTLQILVALLLPLIDFMNHSVLK